VKNGKTSAHPKTHFHFSLIEIILDCFHDLKLDWSLKMQEPEKQILSFGFEFWDELFN